MIRPGQTDTQRPQLIHAVSSQAATSSFVIHRIAEDVCESLGKSLGKKLDPIEIGYLAMHIERTVEQ